MIWANPLEAACYLSLDTTKAKATSLSTQVTALLSRYVMPVEPMPSAGVPEGHCIFYASLTQEKGQSIFSIKGPRINGLGVSNQKGPRGQTEAMLYALYLGQPGLALRSRICADYPKQLKNLCLPLEVEVLFFDEFARTLPDGAIVKSGESFFILVRPLTALHMQIYNQDARGEIFQIYPNREVNPVANPLAVGQGYFFPQKKGDLIFRFDRTKGKEHFFLAFSAAPLSDLEIAFEKMKQDKNMLSQKDFTLRLSQRGSAAKQMQGQDQEISYRQEFRATTTRFQGQGTFVAHWLFDHR